MTDLTHKFLNIIIGLSVVLLMTVTACSTGGGNSPEPTLDEPSLVSSDPSDGATDVDVKTTVAKLVFDHAVTVVSKSRIKLNGNEVNDAIANDQTLSVSLPALSSETTYTITVEALAIKAVDGGVNTNPISVSFTTAPKQPVVISSTPVMSNPSPEMINLYNFLKENYGKKIISATMANVNWNINEAEWVKLQTGKYPAIATFDYIHMPYSPANWIDYSNTSVVEDWWNANGIVSIGWHWLVPTYEGSTDYTYVPSETTFKASNATVEGTWENDVVKADLEKITGYMKQLQAKNIPFLWRPLHEASGNIDAFDGGKAWFWWGADGAEAYKKLWRYVFNYFESQGLNNMIWDWVTQTNDNEFYPGDDYVDIIGRDVYDNKDSTSIASEFTSIQETYSTKMVTMSECGNCADISAQWNAGAKWSYFMPWYDFDRTKDVNGANFSSPDHKYENADWWNAAFDQSYVITRDQMPSLK